MKTLVIVESPTKAKTIGRFLGKEYVIKASMGHIMDLPKSTLGVNIEKNFTPEFQLMVDKKKTIKELKDAAKTADSVILATDPDREGEAIAAHVAEMLTGKSKKQKDGKFQRIVFHEITKEAVEEALTHPRSINENLVNAQTARRVLDRLVGYKLSPLLWQKVRRGLSAGRVQSVALRLIVEREREIEKFKKEQYFTIYAVITGEKMDIPFDLIEINGEKIEMSETFNLYDGQYKVTKTKITTEKEAEALIADAKPAAYTIADVIQKEAKRSPQPPYTTSTLQQDASRRLGFSGKRTMSLAQKLYEEGYITYHRTDSVVLATSAVQAMRSYAKQQFGDRYVPEKPNVYSTKQKLAQEAHEAIRPTKIETAAVVIEKDLGKDFAKLYDLIWRRALASQMADARIESTTVLADSQKSKKNYRFKATGSVLVFDGFLKVNPSALQDTRLPEFRVGERVDLKSIEKVFHETTPPPRYNDASIIKTLEEKGIGRPSTYATIISTIEARLYIERTEGRFVPTNVGEAVNDFLVQNFSSIDDVPFTADMEDELDKIAHGESKWEPVIKEFYQPFEKKLGEVKEEAGRVKIAVEETDEKCEKCGAPIVVRTGRFGKFLSCSKFPECDFKKPFVEKVEGLKCPKDGADIVAKKTRKGRTFFGCSSYPKCNFAAWKLEEVKQQQEGQTPAAS